MKSAYLKDKILDHTLGVSAFTMPTDVYLALLTSDPTIEDTGDEVVGGSYARQVLSFAVASDGNSETDASVNFDNLPACTVTHWAIYDASTAGNLLHFGEFDIPLIRTAGQDIDIDAGNLNINER